jgi:uncharacterized membrane protein required for colicin V production
MEISTSVGIVFDIIVALVLAFSFIGGLKGGAIKEFFGLAAFLIALLLVGTFRGYFNGWFSFVLDKNWRAIISFLVTLAIISILLHILFWLPRHLLEKIWEGGFLWSLLGGALNSMNSALGLVLLVELLDTYPALGSLDALLSASHVVDWLVNTFGAFVISLMQLVNYTLPLASIFSCAA